MVGVVSVGVEMAMEVEVGERVTMVLAAGRVAAVTWAMVRSRDRAGANPPHRKSCAAA